MKIFEKLKKIYRDADELEEEYGAIELSKEQSVVYKQGRRSYLYAIMLICLVPCGVYRLYIGDKFSIKYGIFLYIAERLGVMFCKEIVFIEDYSYPPYILYPAIIYVVLSVIIYMLDLFIILPIIQKNNLLLKKKIIEDINSVKIRVTYKHWIYITIILSIYCLLGACYDHLWKT